jgi:hypothetical protein
MKRTGPYLIAVFVLTTGITPLYAQIDNIVRALVDHATQPKQSPPPRQQSHRTQTTHQSVAKEQGTPHQSKHPFDGTWLATQSKLNPDTNQMVSRTFTLIIKDGKATRTLDATNASTPEKPFYGSTYELQRRWNYSSTDCVEQGNSLTIQWKSGQLTDWTPKTIPAPAVERFGTPPAETSVYQLNGDELTRVNDPNGLVYHRTK